MPERRPQGPQARWQLATEVWSQPHLQCPTYFPCNQSCRQRGLCGSKMAPGRLRRSQPCEPGQGASLSCSISIPLGRSWEGGSSTERQLTLTSLTNQEWKRGASALCPTTLPFGAVPRGLPSPLSSAPPARLSGLWLALLFSRVRITQHVLNPLSPLAQGEDMPG